MEIIQFIDGKINSLGEASSLTPTHASLDCLLVDSTKIETDVDGNRYEFYLPADINGIYKPDVTKIATETLLQQSNEIKVAIQDHLDTTAKTFKFETGMDRAGSYAGYTNVFQADALTLVTWRANIWAYVEAEEAKVIAGTRAMPTAVEMMAEIAVAFPAPTWA